LDKYTIPKANLRVPISLAGFLKESSNANIHALSCGSVAKMKTFGKPTILTLMRSHSSKLPSPFSASVEPSVFPHPFSNPRHSSNQPLRPSSSNQCTKNDLPALLTTLSLALLRSSTLAKPLPSTDTIDLSNTNITLGIEQALYGQWYIWCGNVQRTIDCTDPPGNYECLESGAPDGDRKIMACRDNCRCLPECSYIASLYQIPCDDKMTDKEWIEELRGQ
jgi:hypothetical protein